MKKSIAEGLALNILKNKWHSFLYVVVEGGGDWDDERILVLRFIFYEGIGFKEQLWL